MERDRESRLERERGHLERDRESRLERERERSLGEGQGE